MFALLTRKKRQNLTKIRVDFQEYYGQNCWHQAFPYRYGPSLPAFPYRTIPYRPFLTGPFLTDRFLGSKLLNFKKIIIVPVTVVTSVFAHIIDQNFQRQKIQDTLNYDSTDNQNGYTCYNDEALKRYFRNPQVLDAFHIDKNWTSAGVQWQDCK